MLKRQPLLFQTPDAIPPKANLRNQLQAASILTNLTDLANSAHGALVLGVVHAAVKCAHLEWAATVDWSVGCSADVKLGELVKLNLDRIHWVALADSLDLLCLYSC